MTSRRAAGAANQRRGVWAESAASRALEEDGWVILGRRLRTPAGEVDLVARRGGLLAFIEVKARPTLGEAAFALGPRQSRRLWQAAEILLASHPEWRAADLRFDLLLVDAAGQVRRIADALRLDVTL